MTDRSDEETLELIKNWWNENGTSLLLTVAVVVAGIFGWRAWQANQAEHLARGADAYAEFQSVAPVLAVAEPGSEQFATASHLAETLKRDFAGSGYAALAAFTLAKVAADKGDTDTAVAELQWVLDAGLPASVADIARMRLARLHAAADRSAEALALVAAVQGAGHKSAALELAGDIHRAGGDLDAARVAYNDAMAAATVSAGDGQVNRPLLQLKIDDLGATS